MSKKKPLITAQLTPEYIAAQKKQVFKRRRIAFIRQTTVIAIIILVLLPIWFVAATAFSGQESLLSDLLPEKWSFDNVHALFNEKGLNYTAWVKNSMIIGVVTASLNVLIGGFGAYAFSRLRFRGRRGTLLSLLMVQVFPSFLALTAIFYIMTFVTDYFPTVGIGTPWAVIIVYTGGALGINAWLIKGFFDTLPKELDESAMIDGANHAQIFFRIILPLALPALAVVFMLSFIGTLNDFILAKILLGPDSTSHTLAVGLAQFMAGGNGDFDTRWGAFTAGAFISSVPVVIIFISLQRYIVTGLTAGSVKG
jgi:arabinogalactan oligomer/maltooligosaccharide transport system permease protein